MHDVFNEYHNLLNGTLNMVVHEWAHVLNTSFENLSFQIDGISTTMHYWCLETSVYLCYLPIDHQLSTETMFLSYN
jgi:hypothetical protein